MGTWGLHSPCAAGREEAAEAEGGQVIMGTALLPVASLNRARGSRQQ